MRFCIYYAVYGNYLVLCYLYAIGARKWEENFPHLNWAIILSIQLLISSNHGILNPSLYQYITTPKTLAPSEPNATEVRKSISCENFAYSNVFVALSSMKYCEYTS